MKKIEIRFIVFTVIILATLMFAQPVTAANNEKPEELIINVTNVKVKKTNLRPGDKLKLSLKVRGNGFAKIKTAEAVFQSERGQSLALPLKYNSSTIKWNGNIEIPKGMQKGKWKLYEIRVNIENHNNFAGFGPDFVPFGEDDTEVKKLLESGNIKISGTKADYTKPKINLKSFKVLKKGRKLTYRVKVTDKSPIKWVKLDLYDSEDKDFLFEDGGIGTKMKYNKKNKSYEYSFKAPKGIYHVYSITAEDIFGNNVTYYTNDKKIRKYNKPYERLNKFSKYTVKVK